jgi:Tol biopolymer transport system component
LAAPVRDYEAPRLSPDGRRVAVNITDNEGVQVWLYDLGRDALSRLTFQGTTNGFPVWTPDGRRIAFSSSKEGTQHIFWQPADGSGTAERLFSDQYNKFPASFSPDGQELAFSERAPATGGDIWILHLSDRQAQPYVRAPISGGQPQLSPDGHWLTYISDESGRDEVYVQPYPGPGGKWQISTDGGAAPVWNRNGRELFYRSGDKMMAVDIDARSGFVVGKPTQLFEKQEAANFAGANYDVSPDGQRFLMLKPVEQEQAGPTQINVVLNWTEELKRLVPTGSK